jgi:hypothetical protein
MSPDPVPTSVPTNATDCETRLKTMSAARPAGLGRAVAEAGAALGASVADGEGAPRQLATNAERRTRRVPRRRLVTPAS